MPTIITHDIAQTYKRLGMRACLGMMCVVKSFGRTSVDAACSRAAAVMRKS